jgi:hypothetical protein
MPSVVLVPVRSVVPSIRSVLAAQGLPDGVQPDPRVLNLADEAIARYLETAEPIGILEEIGNDAFRETFEGEGRNAHDSPVGSIASGSERLALFAVTLGEPVSAEITRSFRMNDFALGSMLDAVASEGADMTAQALEDDYRRRIRPDGAIDNRYGTLRFSPGYCGWHITGQRKLFDALIPETIGIRINESCLMAPIKSISGVIIHGRKDLFNFEDVFSFCGECATHACRERIKALLEQ